MINSTVTVAQISYTDTTVTNSGPFTITANVRAGYIFSGWTFTGSGSICGSSSSASLSVYSDITVTANYTPTYRVTMIYSSITANGVTSSNATVIGSGPFPITANIRTGYIFSSWTFTGSGSINGASSASLTVNSDMTVTANYIPTYRVTMVNSSITANGVTSSEATVTAGSYFINAIIPSGNTFNGWTFTGNGSINGASSASLTVNSDMIVTANYIPTYRVTMVNSSITVNGVTSSNTTVTVTAGSYFINAIVPSGNTFNGWNYTGSGSISDVYSSSASLTVNSDMIVTANYTPTPPPPITYNVTMINSTITVSSETYTSVQVTSSGPYTIDAIVLSGNTFIGWTVEGNGTISGTGPSASLTVTGDVTVTANYTPTPPPPIIYNVTMINSTITVSSETYTSVQVTSSGPYTIDAIILLGNDFSEWTVEGGGTISGTGPSASLTVTGDVTVTANFTPTPPITYIVFMVNSSITVNGVTSSDTTVTVTAGGPYTIDAIIPSGYDFSEWEITLGDGSISDLYSSSASLTVDSNMIVTAKFDPKPMILHLRITPDEYYPSEFQTPIIFNSSSQSVSINWGDGSPIGTYNSTDLSIIHTYTPTTTTDYTVTISGVASGYGGLYLYLGKDFITEVVQWGTLGMTNFQEAFIGASNLTTVPSTFVPNVTNVSRMFYNCSVFNSDISLWDVSTVTNMSEMFTNAAIFNQPLNDWNVSNVTDMDEMFNSAYNFNQPLNAWNVSGVTTMSHMFFGASAFDQNISGWNVSNVTNMSGMFRRATQFNQNISGWDVSNVTDMSYMFAGVSYDDTTILTTFNQDISVWDVGNVTDATNMFFTSTMCNYHAKWPTFNLGVFGYPNFGCPDPL